MTMSRKVDYNKFGEFKLTRDNLRRLDPKAFEKAAEFLESRKLKDDDKTYYSCIALDNAAGGLYMSDEREAYAAMFDPSNGKTAGFWKADDTSYRRTQRVQALLTAAGAVYAAKASRGAKKPKLSPSLTGLTFGQTQESHV